jgi:hypothetical protein
MAAKITQTVEKSIVGGKTGENSEIIRIFA